jgi:hypothetical protein
MAIATGGPSNPEQQADAGEPDRWRLTHIRLMTSPRCCRLLVLAVSFAFIAGRPAPARAQRAPGGVETIQPLSVQEARPIRAAAESLAGSLMVPQRRDNLWNGVVIGAGLGAIAGALGGVMATDCSECAGFNVPLTFGVLGAAAGAGIGAAVDALHHQRRAAMGRRTRVRVAPLIGKHGRALVASVRF